MHTRAQPSQAHNLPDHSSKLEWVTPELFAFSKFDDTLSGSVQATVERTIGYIAAAYYPSTS